MTIDFYKPPHRKRIFSERLHRLFVVLIGIVSVAGLFLTVYLIAVLTGNN